ncbi:hypothetical protein BJV77DRAFT_187314 [Russula vinacea]|nr:hypothetical protein BJV77DRAFT_187314 [Russula vinacea]
MTAVCVEAVFLKSIGQPIKDVLFAILFTALFGLALPVWSNFKHMQCQLQVPRINSAIHPPAEHVLTPVVTNDPTFRTREGSTSKSIMHPVSKPAHPEPERPDEPSVATDKSPYFPYEHPATEPVAMDHPSPVPQPFPGSYHDGVTLEGMDDMLEVSDVGTDPVKAPLAIESLPSPAPTAPSGLITMRV